MRKYYIYQKTKKTVLIDNSHYPYSDFVMREMPWECLGCIDGAEDLYSYLRRCTKVFRREYIFADSFSCTLDDDIRTAYLVMDDRGKIRDFWEIAKPFEVKRHRKRVHYSPEEYSFRNSPVPGIHKPSHWSGQSASAQMRERRNTLSQKDINALRTEYPDALIHIRRAKREKDCPDLWDDDFLLVPRENKCWKNYKNASRQWDKTKNIAGLYIVKHNNGQYIEEESEYA